VADGNGYRLSGTKQFVSSGSKADLAMVFAVTDPDAGKKGISCLLVPTETEGYTVASHETKMGQRAHDTCQIVFEDVRLTPDLMLGEPGQGYAIALGNLEGGRIGIAVDEDQLEFRGRLQHGSHLPLQHLTPNPSGITYAGKRNGISHCLLCAAMYQQAFEVRYQWPVRTSFAEEEETNQPIVHRDPSNSNGMRSWTPSGGCR